MMSAVFELALKLSPRARARVWCRRAEQTIGAENREQGNRNSPLATGLGGSTGLTGKSAGGGRKSPGDGRASELGDGGAEHLDGCCVLLVWLD